MSYTIEDANRDLVHVAYAADDIADAAAVRLLAFIEQQAAEIERMAKTEELWKEEARHAVINRDYWRDRYEASEDKVSEKDAEIERLQAEVETRPTRKGKAARLLAEKDAEIERLREETSYARCQVNNPDACPRLDSAEAVAADRDRWKAECAGAETRLAEYIAAYNRSEAKAEWLAEHAAAGHLEYDPYVDEDKRNAQLWLQAAEDAIGGECG